MVFSYGLSVVFLLVTGTSALNVASKWWPGPHATLLDSISDDEATDERMSPITMKDFPGLSVMSFAPIEAPKVSMEGRKVSRLLRQRGTYEPKTVKHLCRLYEKYGKKGNMLDVGASSGVISFPLAQCVKEHGTVVAIEGSPQQAKYFRAGMKRNQLNNVRLYQYAVTAKDGKLTGPLADESKTWMDAIVDAEPDIMKKMFAMKIDVDGTERSVFDGATELMSKFQPCVLSMQTEETSKFKATERLIEKEFGYKKTTSDRESGAAIYLKKNIEECVNNL